MCNMAVLLSPLCPPHHQLETMKHTTSPTWLNRAVQGNKRYVITLCLQDYHLDIATAAYMSCAPQKLNSLSVLVCSHYKALSNPRLDMLLSTSYGQAGWQTYLTSRKRPSLRRYSSQVSYTLLWLWLASMDD